jgi:uncharacterized protein YbjT (DUF2867 family)
MEAEMILITGATGNIGRPLTELLVQAGAQVRAVTRDPSGAGLPDGVEIAAPDAPLNRVTSVFLNSRAVGEQAGPLLRLAREHGATRVVALSAVNVDDNPADQPSRYRGDRNKEIEAAAVESGLEWVSLRPTTFAVNNLGLWSGQIRAGDVVRGPYAKASSTPIHEQDLAAVAAHALLNDGLLGQRIVLTGPQALTQEEMVEVIGATIGRNLRYEEVPPQQARARLLDAGFPAGFADTYLAMQAKAAQQPALPTREVEKILSRPALTFAEWAADHKEAFQR